MSRTRSLPSPRFFVIVTTLLLVTSLTFSNGESAPGSNRFQSQRPTGGEFEAEQCIDYGDYFHLRARLATPGQGEAVAVSGQYAYLVDRLGLRVIDLTDPDAPRLEGSLDMPGGAWDVAVSGNYAYVTGSGLQVVDVTNPSVPVVVSFVDIPAGHVTIEGSYAYVTGSDRLHIVDITDPIRPFLTGWVQLRDALSACDVAVSGNYAYVAALRSSWSYLQVIDITDPSLPVIVGSMGNGGSARTVIVSGAPSNAWM